MQYAFAEVLVIAAAVVPGTVLRRELRHDPERNPYSAAWRRGWSDEVRDRNARRARRQLDGHHDRPGAWSYIARLEQQLSDVSRMLDVVTAEHAAAEVRARRAQSAREAILSASDADNAPVAPVLRRALDAADKIGGFGK